MFLMGGNQNNLQSLPIAILSNFLPVLPSFKRTGVATKTRNSTALRAAVCNAWLFGPVGQRPRSQWVRGGVLSLCLEALSPEPSTLDFLTISHWGLIIPRSCLPALFPFVSQILVDLEGNSLHMCGARLLSTHQNLVSEKAI